VDSTVLYLVDDDPLVTDSLGTALRLETSYEVFTFNSGAAAVQAMPSRPPDALITDFKMPAMDGLQVLRAARQAYPDAVLILLTGYADKESAIRAINEVGIYQYVEKPWDLQDLLQKVRAGLERRELARQLARRNQELEQAHARLLDSERLAAVGRVVSGIAHELGNQLALVGYAQAIKEKLGERDADVREWADVIVAAQKRLAGMVGEIKDFVRDAQGEPLRLEPADVASAVDEALAILRYDREVATRKLTREFRARPLARLHRGKFGQVVINLVRNAAQASKAGGELSVTLDEKGQEVVVEIADRGTGMPPEVLARLGEPFFSTRGERGTGLGVGICRRIVTEHGGTLEFHSTVGEGTRAVVTIPALAGEAVA
jgi:signal transduction histidine kinase